MKKIVRLIPYLIVCLILIYTWYVIVNTEYQATLKHYMAWVIAMLNFVAYFIRFNYGLIGTAILLLLATFNTLGLFPEIVYTTYFIRIAGKEIESPPIQGKSFLLLILYLILTCTYWLEKYRAYKSRKNHHE